MQKAHKNADGRNCASLGRGKPLKSLALLTVIPWTTLPLMWATMKEKGIKEPPELNLFAKGG